jgi:hypothetical protein
MSYRTSSVAEVLGRNQSLTEDMWFELVETRRELITPLLDRLTLDRLVQLPLLRNGGSQPRTIGHFLPYDDDRAVHGDYQGVFGDIELKGSYAADSSGVRHIWGLTRKGIWIVATITYTVRRTDVGHIFDELVSRQVDMCHDIRELCLKAETSPHRVWGTLGTTVQLYADKLATQAQEAAMFKGIIRADNDWVLRSLSG